MNIDTQCVILAGGLATRLRPITDNIPKSMVSIENRPFLNYQIELLKNKGVTDIVLCIGHKGSIIKSYFGNGSNLNVKISYSSEDTLLGTGGALRNATNILQDSFLVLYGDAYLDVDYRKIVNYSKQINCPALLTVFKNEGKFDTSNVIFIDDKFVLYDKQNPTKEMQHIDYGLSILSKRIVKQYIPKNTFYDLAGCYNALSKKNQLAGYEVKNRFYEIGTVSGLQDFKNFIQSQETR